MERDARTLSAADQVPHLIVLIRRRRVLIRCAFPHVVPLEMGQLDGGVVRRRRGVKLCSPANSRRRRSRRVPFRRRIEALMKNHLQGLAPLCRALNQPSRSSVSRGLRKLPRRSSGPLEEVHRRFIKTPNVVA